MITPETAPSPCVIMQNFPGRRPAEQELLHDHARWGRVPSSGVIMQKFRAGMAIAHGQPASRAASNAV
jgi:hypothetical protein